VLLFCAWPCARLLSCADVKEILAAFLLALWLQSFFGEAVVLFRHVDRRFGLSKGLSILWLL
jgi:hypothetical protein